MNFSATSDIVSNRQASTRQTDPTEILELYTQTKMATSSCNSTTGASTSPFNPNACGSWFNMSTNVMYTPGGTAMPPCWNNDQVPEIQELGNIIGYDSWLIISAIIGWLSTFICLATYSAICMTLFADCNRKENKMEIKYISDYGPLFLLKKILTRRTVRTKINIMLPIVILAVILGTICPHFIQYLISQLVGNQMYYYQLNWSGAPVNYNINGTIVNNMQGIFMAIRNPYGEACYYVYTGNTGLTYQAIYVQFDYNDALYYVIAILTLCVIIMVGSYIRNTYTDKIIARLRSLTLYDFLVRTTMEDNCSVSKTEKDSQFVFLVDKVGLHLRLYINNFLLEYNTNTLGISMDEYIKLYDNMADIKSTRTYIKEMTGLLEKHGNL